MDTSVLVDLFVPSANDERIRSFLQSRPVMPVISDFAAGEFAGALKRRHLMKLMSASETVAMLGRFDAWCATNAEMVATDAADVRLASVFVRRLDIPLRMPDAIHMAIAHRIDATLCSFDTEQVAAARKLGIDVATVE